MLAGDAQEHQQAEALLARRTGRRRFDNGTLIEKCKSNAGPTLVLGVTGTTPVAAVINNSICIKVGMLPTVVFSSVNDVRTFCCTCGSDT